MVVNTRQTADVLGISRSLVYALCKSGVIAHARHGRPGKRGCIRITEAEVERYRASCQVEAGPTSTPLRHLR